MKIYGYVRRSTDKQAMSPETQASLLRSAAEANGWDLELRYEEAASAKSLDGRPVLAATLADLVAGRGQGLAVTKLDRLSRDVHDFAGLLKRAGREGWAMVCLDLGIDTSTITGAAMAQVTAVFAEMERKRIAERTREAMAKLPDEVRDRMRNGGRPRVVPDATALRIRELAGEGLSFAKIAARLNEEGVPTAKPGGRWWPESCRRLAQRDPAPA